MFNPLCPILSLRLNNRDHRRKIMVIDGKVAFAGGISLADEIYQRKGLKCGRWKDSAIQV
ncbi:MAG: hypothetical protein ACLSAF_17025 [Intestinimonas sp.]